MSKFLLLYRPSTFPPLYEECQGSQDFSVCTPQVVVPTDGMYMSMSLAPPLYSQNNSEITDPSWCWEQPPPYSQAVEMQQGQGHQGEQEEAASAHWHNPFCFPVEGIETFRLKKKKTPEKLDFSCVVKLQRAGAAMKMHPLFMDREDLVFSLQPGSNMLLKCCFPEKSVRSSFENCWVICQATNSVLI